MDKIIFTEEFCQPENLYPFTLTRHLQDIRVGILTIREKWEKLLQLPSFNKKEASYKDGSHAIDLLDAVQDGDCYLIHGNVLPTPALIQAVQQLQHGQVITTIDGLHIIYKLSKQDINEQQQIKVNQSIPFHQPLPVIQYPWDIFTKNDWAIRQDFALLTQQAISQPLPSFVQVQQPKQVFVEEGAVIGAGVIINAATGPVYIGKSTTIMEGAIIRGPFAMGENAVVKMGAKIYGATTIGPHSVVGGEIKNVVIFGHSNKAHDGYLGDAVIGEWCNIGAGVSNSNLKNTANDVFIWLPNGKHNAGKKCGVLMGDYARVAINTSINTGTVIGAGANVFTNGLTPKFIPSFAWGIDDTIKYNFDKALEHINNWKKLKGSSVTTEEKNLLHYIYNHI